MKQWNETLGPGLSVDIYDFEMGSYQYRITVPMVMTKNLGPESEYAPINQVLYDHVAKTLDQLMPARQFAPGGWDIINKIELDTCLQNLKRI